MKQTAAFFVTTILIGASPLIAADKWDLSRVDVSKLPAPAQKKGVTYATDIKPLFEASCIRCHGEQRPKGDLKLNSLEAVLKGGKDGKAVIPGDSKKSPLVIAAAQIDDETAMPPKKGPGRGGPGGPGRPGGGAAGAGGPGGPRGPGAAPGGGEGTGGQRPGGGGGAGGPGGPGGPGGGGFGGPAPKPLTPEQVGLLRAWIDQGAK